MKLGRNRWFVRLALVLLVGLAVVFWSLSQRSRSFTVENRSKQSVADLKITLSGETSTFKNIKVGDEVSAPCPSIGNDLYTVEGRLADGTLIRSSGRIGEGKHFQLLPGGKLEELRKSQRRWSGWTD